MLLSTLAIGCRMQGHGCARQANGMERSLLFGALDADSPASIARASAVQILRRDWHRRAGDDLRSRRAAPSGLHSRAVILIAHAIKARSRRTQRPLALRKQ